MVRKSRKKRGSGLFSIGLGKPCKGSEFSKKCGTKNCEADPNSTTGFSCQYRPGTKGKRERVNCSEFDDNIDGCKKSKWCVLSPAPQGEYADMHARDLNQMPTEQIKLASTDPNTLKKHRNLYCQGPDNTSARRSDAHVARDRCARGERASCGTVFRNEDKPGFDPMAYPRAVGMKGGRRKRRKSRKKKHKKHKRKTKKRRKSRKKRTKRRR